MAVKVVRRPKLTWWEKTYIPQTLSGLKITFRHFFRNLFLHTAHRFGRLKNVRASATYTRQELWGLPKASVSLRGAYVARQGRFDLAADLASPPDGYFLLDAEVGAEARVADQTVRVALQGTNLLNSRYRDYTSLLRYFADQPGWQLMLRLSVHYSQER